jgi:hypothetical protein
VCDPNSLDHLFMEGQLAEYKGAGPGETYETLRLTGRRIASASAGRESEPEQRQADQSGIEGKEVHVYDMFWSDLSGVGLTGLRMFGELYQLLFHMGSVGVNNVNAAAITLRDTAAGPAWYRFSAAQKRAAAILALPIPLLNLLLLAFAVATVATCCLTKLTVVQESIATAAMLLAVAAGVWGYALLRRGRFGPRAFRWPVMLFILLLSLVSLVAVWNGKWLNGQQQWSEAIECVAALIVLGAALAATLGVAAAYEKRRPGAKRTFCYLMVAVAIFAIASIPRMPPESHDFLAASLLLRLVELTFWALAIAWQLFWGAFVWAFLTGRTAVKNTAATVPEEADRAARTNWTARLTIAIPATLFLLLTFAGWAGLLSVSLPLLPHSATAENRDCLAGSSRNPETAKLPSLLCYSPLYPTHAAAETAGNWAWNTLFRAGAGFAPAILLLAAMAAIISIWGLAPSILNEVSPPDPTDSKIGREAAAQGDWLDDGYRFMRWAGRLIYVGIFAFPLATVLALLPDWQFMREYRHAAIPLECALGTAVAGAGIGILGFGGRLSKLALGFRPIVRVGLDVDNWLRERPLDANPTARICSRYVSLLRYIARWKDEKGRGYDALIIFAHSQGTVITADLLRFLEVEARASGSYAGYDETLAGLDRMKRHLFTMGCPLRQLYGLRFPYLYGYAPAGRGDELLPEPACLGVAQWVNAYRTGDYIGRYLWHRNFREPIGPTSFRNSDPSRGAPVDIWTEGTRVEFSIGPGAHTHYWDSTAGPIADTLDALIALA